MSRKKNFERCATSMYYLFVIKHDIHAVKNIMTFEMNETKILLENVQGEMRNK